MDSQIVKTAKEYRTIVAYAGEYSGEGCKEAEEKAEQLHAAGVETVSVPDADGRVDLRKLMEYLGKQGIDSVLLEGGAALNGSALQAGIVSCVQTYIAPKIFGGQEAKSPVGGSGVKLACEAYEFEIKEIRRIGEDILIRSVPKKIQEGV
mgnify:FL=1